MKSIIGKTVFVLALALLSKSVPAADFPTLERDGRITAGRLENGISYYIVSNSLDGDACDIALVQKAGRDGESLSEKGISEYHSRGALSSLPRFGSPSPLEYLVSKGVSPGRDGYASLGDEATVFHFADVPVTATLEAVDSTLLMVFEIIASAPGAKTRRYSPDNQAIIIAGNVTPGAMVGKLEMLSMLVKKRTPSSVKSYEWEPEGGPFVQVDRSEGGISTLTLSWRSPRTPAERMGTVLPVITKMFYDELSALISKRLELAFREADLPVASFGTDYTPSGKTSDDETFCVRVATSDRYILEAAEIVTGLVARLGREGVSPEEYHDVRMRVREQYVSEASGQVFDNAGFVRSCIESFLYGKFLSTKAGRLAFISSRRMPDAPAADLFNSFAKAQLSDKANLSASCLTGSPLIDGDVLLKLISDAWSQGGDAYRTVPIGYSDTVSVACLRNTRVKIKESEAEPMSGGVVLPSSNGIRVVFKQGDQEAEFIRVSILFKGGYTQIPGLDPSAGPYVSDMLFLGNIGGMPGYRFREMLLSNSISLDVDVLPAEFRLSAHLPATKLPLLMRSLSAIMAERSIDNGRYDYYRRCRELSFAQSSDPSRRRFDRLDSLLCPKGFYPVARRSAVLPDNLPAKAEDFFARSFAGVRDAVWVVTGDITEDNLRKVLTSNLGRFRTPQGGIGRFRGKSQYLSGEKTFTLDSAAAPSVDLGFTMAPSGLGLQNYMANVVAAEVIGSTVAAAVAPLGWYCQAAWDLRLFPDDRLTLKLLLSPAAESGLPASMMPAESSETAFSAARSSLEKLKAEGVSAEMMHRVKSSVLNKCLSWPSGSLTATWLLEMRYMYGIDFMSSVSDKAAAVKSGNVNAIIATLLSGGRVNVIVPGPVTPEVKPEPALEEPQMPEAAPATAPSDSTGLLGEYRHLVLEGRAPGDTLGFTKSAGYWRLSISRDSVMVLLRDSTSFIPQDSLIVAPPALPDSLAVTSPSSEPVPEPVPAPAAADSLVVTVLP